MTFTASATDAVDATVPVTCTPASGSTFPLATTTVTCTATNTAGRTTTGSFRVTVRDTTPPSLTLPANISTQATTSSGAVVSYTATATDLVDGAITPTCTPASGSTFAVGTNTVTCTATDRAANQATGAFTITVTALPLATIALSTRSLTFTAFQSGTNPAGQTVSITNTGAGTLNWTATPSTTSGGLWLSVSPISGTAPFVLTVSANITALAVGTYSGSISIAASATTNSPQTISVTLNVLTSAPAGGGVVTAGSIQAGPGGTARVAMTMTLASGVGVDTVSFGVSVTPNGTAPALSTNLSFVKDAAMPNPDFVDFGFATNAISVAWLQLTSPLTGTVRLGEVVVTIPSGATSGQSYTVKVTGASGSLVNTPITLVPGSDSTISILGSFVPLGGRGPDLLVRAEEVTYTPLFPREGDTVKFRVRVHNRGERPAPQVQVALLARDRLLAGERVEVAAKRAVTVELEWKAERFPGRDLRLAVHAAEALDENARDQITVALRNFVVEPRGGPASVRRERLTLEVRNEGCAGLRLLTAAQTSCGGHVDLELSPALTYQGRLELQASSPQGGLVDLGVQMLTTVPAAPSAGYQPQGLLEEGHTYALKTRNRYALLRVVRVRSSVNPRLVASDRQTRRGGSRITVGRVLGDDPLADAREGRALDRVLDGALITIDLEWLVQEDGSASFQ